MYIGHDHTTNGVINGSNIVCHRIDFPIDMSKTDDTIRHQLIHGKYFDETYTKPKSLYEILNECILYNVIPVININACWWYKESMPQKITKAELAKIASILRDYLKERGFNKNTAFISVFNEPGKWLTDAIIAQYTNAVHDEVGEDFHVIYGNDEWNMVGWNYLGQNCRAEIMGVHHLSSIGNWDNPKAYFTNIRDAKTVANQYSKLVAGTECGSWFKPYNGAGHLINKEIIAECKKYEYLFCLIVLVDMNQNDYENYKRILGYRVWDSTFTNWINQNEKAYFEDFINYIKEGGQTMSYNAPQKLQAIANYLGFSIGEYEPELPILTGTGFWQNAGSTHKRAQAMTKADFDATFEKLIKMILTLSGETELSNFEGYYKADGSWNSDWSIFAKSGGLK